MKTEQWTAALRSGKYPQGQNALCDGSRFCCLGVLAEEAGYGKVENNEGTFEYIFGLEDDQTVTEDAVIPHYLQKTILEDLNLRQSVGPASFDGEEYGTESLHTRLIIMNDNGVGFSTIADYVEKVVANGSR